MKTAFNIKPNLCQNKVKCRLKIKKTNPKTKSKNNKTKQKILFFLKLDSIFKKIKMEGNKQWKTPLPTKNNNEQINKQNTTYQPTQQNQRKSKLFMLTNTRESWLIAECLVNAHHASCKTKMNRKRILNHSVCWCMVFPPSYLFYKYVSYIYKTFALKDESNWWSQPSMCLSFWSLNSPEER